jgi:hypothetical protein
VDGWPDDAGRARMPEQVDSLSSHPGRRDSLRRGNLLAAVCVVALALAASATAMRNRHPDWPTGCGVEGHADWCAAPSRAMTDAAVTGLVRDYCPGLASQPDGMVPRPLALVDLAGPDTFARTTGTRESGTEDSLLGRGKRFAWVTRWSGGPEDGVVELRCPGRSRQVPSVHLERDQFRSTVEAARGEAGRIDFARLARSMAGRAPGRFAISYGFVSCDTTGLDLRHLEAGTEFTCRIEVYSRLGQGGDQVSYRVTAVRPYFEVADPRS